MGMNSGINIKMRLVHWKSSKVLIRATELTEWERKQNGDGVFDLFTLRFIC